MIPKPLLIMAVAVAVLGLFLWHKNASALDYYADWGDALAEARDSGKPLFINFGGDW